MTSATRVATLTRMQEDLLKAAFAADPNGIAAWRRWRDAVDWDTDLDHHSFRLLPRIWRNLVRQGVADTLLPRLKGITRHAWYTNQKRSRAFRPTLQALSGAGVEVLVLPPTAILLHDAAVFDRYVQLNCAVRATQAEAAVDCLWRRGWRTSARLPRWSLAGYVRAADHLVWLHGNDEALDLCWQWDLGDRRGRLPDDVWKSARLVRWAHEPVFALDAAHAVHDLCGQPVAANPFGHIVDVVLAMCATETSPDWRGFLARVAQAPVDARWRGTLGDLRALLPAVVPASVLADWPAAGPEPVPAPGAARGTMRQRVVAHWATYRDTWGQHYSFGAALRNLPGYLMARWHLPAPGRIPLRLLRGLRHEWRDARRSP